MCSVAPGYVVVTLHIGVYYFYFDASALVKRYTEEIGSNKVDFIFANVPLNT